MKYFTSDHHFGDPRLNLFPRFFENAEEMGEFMIDEWNKVVGPTDDVYYLGDFAYTKEALQNVHKLNGRKHLIVGNHDEKFGVKTLKPFFESVQDIMDMTIQDGDKKLDIHLVHYPSKGVSNKFNLVGHIHGTWRIQKNMINVGVDAWHFKPLTEKEILFFFTAICDHYDNDVWVADDYSNSRHNERGKLSETSKIEKESSDFYKCPNCKKYSVNHTLLHSFCSKCGWESKF